MIDHNNNDDDDNADNNSNNVSSRMRNDDKYSTYSGVIEPSYHTANNIVFSGVNIRSPEGNNLSLVKNVANNSDVVASSQCRSGFMIITIV